jgi:hypothetical protein
MAILQRFINKKQDKEYSLIIVVICTAFFLGLIAGLTAKFIIIGGLIK